MINMPQMVAALHSFVGIAATIIGYADFLKQTSINNYNIVTLTFTFIGVFIGSVTFSGSIIACAKLNGNIRSAPLIIGGNFRHALNCLIMLFCIALGYFFVVEHTILYLAVMTGLALFFGWHLVIKKNNKIIKKK